MRQKICALLILFFIIGSTIGTGLAIQEENGNGTVIYVDDDNVGGPWDGSIDYPFEHIQDAVDDASGGEEIFVFVGIYREIIVIDKQVVLRGENKSTTVVDGMYNNTVIQVLQDETTIQNITIKNSGGDKDNAGVIIDAKNVTIQECIIHQTRSGIFVNGTCNNLIIACIFHTNGKGILLQSSANNEIENCCFFHNAIGVYYNHAEKEQIRNSCAHTNGIGILGNDSLSLDIAYCTLQDNNDNQGGVFLVSCSQAIIHDCVMRHNGVGVKTAHSSNVVIGDCLLTLNTHYAVRIKEESTNVTVDGCDIIDNFRYGVYVQNSSCRVIGNNFYHNTLHGLYAELSSCDARYNWWGSRFGPARFTGLRRAERVMWSPGNVLIFPWQRTLFVRSCVYPSNPCSGMSAPEDTHPLITFPEQDTDNDGCPDWWEEKWGYDTDSVQDHAHLDPDGDALTNIEECYTDQWGSNPFYKDIFLECDWIESRILGAANKPTSHQFLTMETVFAQHNIALHIDDGRLGGGEELPYADPLTYGMIVDRYWDYFLHNDLNNPRKGIFHYCLICDYGPGGGFAFVGWDHLDSFSLSAQLLQEGFPTYNRGELLVSATMHELGHTLGLLVDDFGGNDNLAAVYPQYKEYWTYLSYKSCMNYRYTWDILDYSDGTHLGRDFDDWGNLDFSFFKGTHFEWPKIYGA